MLLICRDVWWICRKKKCEESCQQPCIHIEYETSLSYETLQKNVLIKKLNFAARTVKPTLQTFLKQVRVFVFRF